MSEDTQARQEPFQAAQGYSSEGVGVFRRVAKKLRLFVHRTIFWSYERGSWQYDLICVAILALIFLTPRTWFQDRPTLQLTDVRHRQGVIELGVDKDGRRYMIDARLVESLGSMRLEDAAGEILRRRLQKAPVIRSVGPIQDQNGVVLGYNVVVAP